MNNSFDSMIKEFDQSINNIIEIARAATLLGELRAQSPETLVPPASLPSTPVSPASSSPASPAPAPASPAPAPVQAPASPAPAPAPAPARRRPGRPARHVHSTAPKSPKSPKSPKVIPSVSTSAKNMHRALLAKAPAQLPHKLTDAELDARKNSSNKRTRWRAVDVETRRANRAKAIAARKAGDPNALCALTKERLQKALQPNECTDPALPRYAVTEIKTAHDIVTIHGPTHKDYPISCARLCVVQDVLAAKMSIPVELRSSVHLVARMAALRAFVVNTDEVVTTAKQLVKF